MSPATIIVSSSPTVVPYGPPVFIGHGTPGSRLDRYAGLDDPEWVRRRRLRFIGVDRPGYGCSDPWPEANLLAP